MKQKIPAALAIVIVLNISVLSLLFRGDVPGEDGPVDKTREDTHSSLPLDNRPDSEPPPSHARDVDASLRALTRSAVEGDSRSPRLLKSAENRRTPADDALLADPAAYERAQSRARTSIVRAFSRAADHRLEKVRENIQGAEHAGVRSENEMREAREALKELEKAREHLRGLKGRAKARP